MCDTRSEGFLNILLPWLIVDYEHNILWYIELKVWWRWNGNDLYVWSDRVYKDKINTM